MAYYVRCIIDLTQQLTHYIIITADSLTFVGKDLKMVTKEGEFDILIDKEKRRIYYRINFNHLQFQKK